MKSIPQASKEGLSVNRMAHWARLPISAVIGFSFLLSWPYCAFMVNGLSLPERNGGSLNALCWLLSLLSVAITLLCIAVRGERVDKILARPASVCAAGALQLMANLAITICSASALEALDSIILAASVISGVATAALQIQWAHGLGTQGIRRATSIIPISSAASFLETFLLSFVPKPFTAPIILGQIVFSVGILVGLHLNTSTRHSEEILVSPEGTCSVPNYNTTGLTDGERHSKHVTVDPLSITDFIVIFFSCVCLSFVDSINRTTTQATSPDFPLVIIFALFTGIAVTLFYTFGSRDLTFGSVCRLVIPLLLGSLFFCSTHEVRLRVSAFIVVFSTSILLVVFIWIAGTTYGPRRNGGVARTLGIPLCIHYFGAVTGSIIGLFTAGFAGMTVAFAIATVFAATIFALAPRITTQPPVVAREYVDSRTEAFTRIATRYGLSNREAEIFELFASGRNAAYICETCFISKNTVDTHLRHIYDKTGVRSKQKLIDMVEDEIEQLESENAETP